MFVKPSLIINLQQGLGEFSQLCNEYNYKPTKEEIKDIIDYLLIVQHYSMNGTMTESVNTEKLELNEVTIDYLYENFNLLLVESGGVDPIGIGELGGLLGAAGAFTAVLFGKGKGGSEDESGPFAYISYLFKKGKIKSILGKIDSVNTQNLKDFQKLIELEKQKSKLQGKDEIEGVSSFVPSYQ